MITSYFCTRAPGVNAQPFRLQFRVRRRPRGRGLTFRNGPLLGIRTEMSGPMGIIATLCGLIL